MKNRIAKSIHQVGLFKESEFFRFLIVGGINTIIGYCVTLILFYWFHMDYRASQFANFIICFPIAYSLQAIYAFRTKWSYQRLFLYPISSLPNYLFQFVTLIICVEIFQIPEYLAYLVSYVVPIPIMFVVVKFLVKPNENKKTKRKNTLTRNNFISYTILYSLFFIIIFLLGFKDFLFVQEKSFIWHLDGVTQHFAFLYDWSETLKEMFRNFNGIPLWSWQLGLGGDLISSYSYYLLGDPLSNLVALLFPLSKIELGYNIMVVVRIFLVGFSLLYYCKYMGLKQMPSVIGSLLYAFSGHILFWGIRHPFFINAAVLLPLLLVSIEEILKRKKGHLFIICVAFSAVNSFYFFYMNTIAIFIYAVVRFFYYVEEDRAKVFFKMLFRVSCYYILGVAIGSVLFIPTAYGFFNTYRVPVDLRPDFALSLDKFIKMFGRFGILDYEKRTLRVSVAFVSFPIVLLFLGFKDRMSKSFKVLFVVFTTLLCLPFMHSVFNGFSTANDRWVYIYICMICFIVAYTLDNMQKISNMNRAIWALLAFAYLGIIEFEFTLLNLLLTSMGIGCLLIFYMSYNRNLLKTNERIKTKGLVEIGVLLLVTVNLITNVSALMSQRNYGNEFSDYNTVLNKYKSSKTAVVPPMKENEFYRVEYEDRSDNKSVVNNFNGTHIFNSIIDKDIIEFYNYTQLRTKLGASAYMGFDQISSLNSLMGVKYYIANKDKKHVVPYGFALHSTKGNVIIYKNLNELPLGFVYYNTLLKVDYEGLTGVDRTYAMMDGAMVEEDIEGVNKRQTLRTSKWLKYKVVSSNGVKLTGDEAFVSKNKGSIILKVKNANYSELYMFIRRVYFQDKNKNFKITVETNHTKKTIETRSINNTYYVDNRDYLYNLGTDEASEIKVKISFSRKGEYNFDQLAFQEMDLKDFREKVDNLKKTTLKNIKISNNFVSGKVTLEQKGLLFLSIPHSPGWIAFVDGKEVETQKVNIAFTGIVLEEGDHEISLKYRTPLIIPCVLISACGIFVFSLMIFFGRKRNE